MKRDQLVAVLLVGLLLMVVLAFAGCGNGKKNAAFYTASERCAYAADGDVAFAFYGGNGLRYIGLISEKGGTVNTLTPSANDPTVTDEGGWHPAISPDGTQLAMTSKRAQTGEVTSNNIYLIPTSGGESTSITQLTHGPRDSDMANWSPDGSKIVFVSDRTGHNCLWVMNANGTGQTLLWGGKGNNQWPCYNPKNADKVAFSSDRAGDAQHTDLWILTVSTKTVVRVTTGPLRNECPAWSPDGTQLLFHSNRAGDFDIWRIKPDGTGLKQLISGPNSDGFPVWRPDAGRLAFTRDRQVWTAAQDGTDLVQLTTTF